MKTIETLRKLAGAAKEEWYGDGLGSRRATNAYIADIDPATLQAILDSHERLRAALERQALATCPCFGGDCCSCVSARAALAAAYPA